MSGNNSYIAENALRDHNEAVKKEINKVLFQIGSGFQWAKFIYIAVFFIGVLFTVTSICASIFDIGGKDAALIFGGMGITDFAALFFFKPAEKLEKSRAKLAQLQAVYATWLNDSNIWSQFLKGKASSIGITMDEVEKISEKMISNTMRIAESMSDFLKNK